MRVTGGAIMLIDWVRSRSSFLARSAALAGVFAFAAAGLTVIASYGTAATTLEAHADTSAEPGYWIVDTHGNVIAYGARGYLHHRGALRGVVVGIASAQNGYWLATDVGAVAAYGAAPYLGSLRAQHLHQHVVGIAATADRKGYWLAGANGGVFAFGDARYLGSLGGRHLSARVVGIASLPSGQGYWLVTKDAHIISFGQARTYAPRGRWRLRGAAGMAPTPDGRGYWLVSRRGSVMAYGDAQPYGSLSPISSAGRVVGVAPTVDGGGYWLVTSKGHVFAFGDALRLRSPMTYEAHQLIAGIATAGGASGFSGGTAKGRGPSTTSTSTSVTQVAPTTTGTATISSSSPTTMSMPPIGGATTTTSSNPTTAGAATSTAGATTQPTTTSTSGASTSSSAPTTSNPPAGMTATATPVCGSSVLKSPYSYDGIGGNSLAAYTSTSPGYGTVLPPFGPGTPFPQATSANVVSGVPSVPLDSAATLYYFEPGAHDTGGNGWLPGNGSVYIGGYNSTAGPAVIDGGGASGSRYQFLNGQAQNITIEYLSIQNWASSQNSSFINSNEEPGWTIEYNTIGPNMASWSGNNGNYTGQDSLGGYAMDLGDDNTVEYNCITQNSQGGFNASGGPGSLQTGTVVSHNEISYNGLGDYPDPCGCVAGGKFFWTTNFVFTDNYVHDNYGVGVWGDFNNAGATITGNYISGNWGQAIMYEASYNADISNNSIVGNGWPYDGPWPSASCYGGVNCSEGLGPVTGGGGGFPYSAIYLANSGGNSLVASNYSGQLLVQNNYLKDNFGGVAIYTDSGRFSGGRVETQQDSPLQSANTTYYQNIAQWQDNSASTQGGSPGVTTGDSGFNIFYNSGTGGLGATQTPSCTSEACGGGLGTFVARASQGNPITGTLYVDSVTGFPSSGSLSVDTTTGVAHLTYTGTQVSPPAFTGVQGSGTTLHNDYDAVREPTSTNLYAYGAGIPTVNGEGDPVTCSSPTSCTLSVPATATATGTIDIVSSGGCGLYDLYGSRPGAATGSPTADYWDNCSWGSRNVSVSNNVFDLDTSNDPLCTAANMCGAIATMAFANGTPGNWWDFYGDNYPAVIAKATGGLGDVWSDNTYQFSGSGGYGSWQIYAGDQGTAATPGTWQTTDGQDVGSAGL